MMNNGAMKRLHSGVMGVRCSSVAFLFQCPTFYSIIDNLLALFYSGSEIKSWKQKFNNADFGAQKGGDPNAPKDSSLIQWAGGLHQRADFNKRRDQLGSWTEVLFHH